MRSIAALLVAGALLVGPAPAAPARDIPRPRLFAGYGVVELRLEAPLGQLFATSKGKAGDDTPVDGVLGYTDPDTHRDITIRPVKVSIRGNTSRRDSECAFPKLRIDLPRGDVPGDSIFAGVDTVKVGTHCGERSDDDLTKLGRLANEKAPIREAVVYRLLDAAAVPTLKARPARISYVDGGRTIVRGALLLEDDRAASARLGAAGELKEFSNARDDFAVDDAANAAFAEAMIGNFDWAIKFAPDDYFRNDNVNPLWNVLALKRGDGTAFPLIYDFDLAGPVTGTHPWFERVYYDGFLPTKSHPGIEALGQVERTRTLFDRAVLDRTRKRFLGIKEAAYRVLDEATIDAEGRAVAREYLDGFYAAIANDRTFYGPVVVREGAFPFAAASGDAVVCGGGDKMPVGTGVSEPLAREGTRVQVALLDVWWHWASRCDAVHRGPVWVDADAIGTDFPRR